MELEDDTRKPVWDEELTNWDDPIVSVDIENSEFGISDDSLVVDSAGSGFDLNLLDEDVSGSHLNDPLMILDGYLESIDLEVSPNPSYLSENLKWFISILNLCFLSLGLFIIRKVKEVINLLGWLRIVISEFYFSWKPPPLIGLSIFKIKRVVGYSGCSIVYTVFKSYQIFKHGLCSWKWLKVVRDKSILVRVIRKRNLVTHMWNVGVFVYNLFRTCQGMKRVSYPFQKILDWCTNRKDGKWKFEIPCIRTLWFVLFYIFGYFNVQKMKAVWFGYDHGFGLINTRLGDSSWSTTFGVYSFGAECISLVDPCSEVDTVIKWVGSKLLNINPNLFVGTLIVVLADFINEGLDVRIQLSQISFEREVCVWSSVQEDVPEMWSFPSKGGGDDTISFRALLGDTYLNAYLLESVSQMDYTLRLETLARGYLRLRRGTWLWIFYDPMITLENTCKNSVVRFIWLVAWGGFILSYNLGTKSTKAREIRMTWKDVRSHGFKSYMLFYGCPKRATTSQKLPTHFFHKTAKFRVTGQKMRRRRRRRHMVASQYLCRSAFSILELFNFLCI